MVLVLHKRTASIQLVTGIISGKELLVHWQYRIERKSSTFWDFVFTELSTYLEYSKNKQPNNTGIRNVNLYETFIQFKFYEMRRTRRCEQSRSDTSEKRRM